MEKLVQELQGRLGEEGLKLQEPMKEHTTFRVGGPADLFIMPKDAEELKDVQGVIEFRDVTYAYDESKEVLHNINLRLEKGRKLALVGPSGGGKTTLLRCLNFLEKANSGEIAVNGKTVYSAKDGEKPVITPEAQLSFGLVFARRHSLH